MWKKVGHEVEVAKVVFVLVGHGLEEGFIWNLYWDKLSLDKNFDF